MIFNFPSLFNLAMNPVLSMVKKSIGTLLTVLVYEHPDRNARHVKPVEKILYAVLRVVIDVVRILQLEHALRHRLHHVAVPVPDLHQAVAEVRQGFRGHVHALELDHLVEAHRIPVINRHHRRHAEQVLGQQRDLLHYVGEPHRQLLAEEYEGLALAWVPT